MDYQTSLTFLKQAFVANNYDAHLSAGRQHAATLVADQCSNGSTIRISFPGYKATQDKPDYRVDLTKNGVTAALSHTNIIVDLFNKCQNGHMSRHDLRDVLLEEACQTNTTAHTLANRLSYIPVAPPSHLKNEARAAHGAKLYNPDGNRFDLTIEELFTTIKWIVLQEDINYPQPRFLGRKMPFSRYLETLHVLDSGHCLQEVIDRTLAHSRPAPWPDMDYSFLTQIY